MKYRILAILSLAVFTACSKEKNSNPSSPTNTRTEAPRSQSMENNKLYTHTEVRQSAFKRLEKVYSSSQTYLLLKHEKIGFLPCLFASTLQRNRSLDSNANTKCWQSASLLQRFLYGNGDIRRYLQTLQREDFLPFETPTVFIDEKSFSEINNEWLALLQMLTSADPNTADLLRQESVTRLEALGSKIFSYIFRYAYHDNIRSDFLAANLQEINRGSPVENIIHSPYAEPKNWLDAWSKDLGIQINNDLTQVFFMLRDPSVNDSTISRDLTNPVITEAAGVQSFAGKLSEIPKGTQKGFNFRCALRVLIDIIGLFNENLAQQATNILNAIIGKNSPVTFAEAAVALGLVEIEVRDTFPIYSIDGTPYIFDPGRPPTALVEFNRRHFVISKDPADSGAVLGIEKAAKYSQVYPIAPVVHCPSNDPGCPMSALRYRLDHALADIRSKANLLRYESINDGPLSSLLEERMLRYLRSAMDGTRSD